MSVSQQAIGGVALVAGAAAFYHLNSSPWIVTTLFQPLEAQCKADVAKGDYVLGLAGFDVYVCLIKLFAQGTAATRTGVAYFCWHVGPILVAALAWYYEMTRIKSLKLRTAMLYAGIPIAAISVFIGIGVGGCFHLPLYIWASRHNTKDIAFANTVAPAGASSVIWIWMSWGAVTISQLILTGRAFANAANFSILTPLLAHAPLLYLLGAFRVPTLTSAKATKATEQVCNSFIFVGGVSFALYVAAFFDLIQKFSLLTNPVSAVGAIYAELASNVYLHFLVVDGLLLVGYLVLFLLVNDASSIDFVELVVLSILASPGTAFAVAFYRREKALNNMDFVVSDGQRKTRA